MERYQVILAYDGSHYKGFQRQAHAPSVQAVVEEALHRLNWRGKSILAAGRTDTGTHATGQVIAFDLDWEHGPHDLQTAMNAYLPPDVVARDVREVNGTFHPRHDASWRRYNYRIYCQPVRQPLLEPYAWRVWPAVDVAQLDKTAQLFIGTRDFGAFGTPPQPGGSTIRMVHESGWNEEAPYLVFDIAAQAFLYHMVRRIVFMQIAIAQGKQTNASLETALKNGVDPGLSDGQAEKSAQRMVHGLAPAHGLILAEVHYRQECLQLSEDKKY